MNTDIISLLILAVTIANLMLTMVVLKDRQFLEEDNKIVRFKNELLQTALNKTRQELMTMHAKLKKEENNDGK